MFSSPLDSAPLLPAGSLVAASASLERQVRTLQNALAASRGQVRRLEGELARSSVSQEGLRRHVFRLERDFLAAGVLAAIPSRDPSPGSRLGPAADVPHSLVGTAAAGVSAQLSSSRRPQAQAYGKCSPFACEFD